MSSSSRAPFYEFKSSSIQNKVVPPNFNMKWSGTFLSSDYPTAPTYALNKEKIPDIKPGYWQNRSNFYDKLNFLNQYTKRDYTIVYAAEDTPEIIPLLVSLYPNCIFHIYSPDNYQNLFDRKVPDNVLINPYFRGLKVKGEDYGIVTEEVAKWYAAKKETLLFFGDNTSYGSLKNDESLIKIMKPYGALINFRPSRSYTEFPYFEGEIFFPIYGRHASFTTRLNVISTNVVKYNINRYSQCLNWYNYHGRQEDLATVNFLGRDLYMYFDSPYINTDSYNEVVMISEYLSGWLEKEPTPDDILQFIDKVNKHTMLPRTLFQDYLLDEKRVLDLHNILAEPRARYEERLAYSNVTPSLKNPEVDTRKWVNSLLLGVSYDPVVLPSTKGAAPAAVRSSIIGVSKSVKVASEPPASVFEQVKPAFKHDQLDKMIPHNNYSTKVVLKNTETGEKIVPKKAVVGTGTGKVAVSPTAPATPKITREDIWRTKVRDIREYLTNELDREDTEDFEKFETFLKTLTAYYEFQEMVKSKEYSRNDLKDFDLVAAIPEREIALTIKDITDYILDDMPFVEEVEMEGQTPFEKAQDLFQRYYHEDFELLPEEADPGYTLLDE